MTFKVIEPNGYLLSSDALQCNISTNAAEKSATPIEVVLGRVESRKCPLWDNVCRSRVAHKVNHYTETRTQS
jgi:hypothetical protein